MVVLSVQSYSPGTHWEELEDIRTPAEAEALDVHTVVRHSSSLDDYWEVLVHLAKARVTKHRCQCRSSRR